jgi:transglutaminase-like putative cysteine protease
MTTTAHTIPATIEPPEATTPSERLARGGGWWTLVLALLMLLAVTESLNAAEWSEGLEIVRLAVLGGALLSFMLALTRWDGAFPVVYSILASFVWISILFTQLLFKDFTMREGAIELFQRNVNWIRALIDGTSGADNLIFVTQLSILGWWIGYLAIWSLFRHQRLLSAIIPGGVALLVNAYYSTVPMTGYLVLYAASVLLLAIRIELARNEARWQVTRVRYAPDITLDFLKAGVAFAALVILLAWAMPDVTQNLTVERIMRPFEGPWHRIEDTWNRMYKSLNYGATATAVSAFGKSMTFGGPVSLTDRPIFDADAPERTYWRAAAYDEYTSSGWQNTSPDVAVIDSNQPFREPQVSSTQPMTVTVYPLEQNQELIFAPPQPRQVSVPVNADIRLVPNPDNENEPYQAVSLLKSRVRIDPDAGYNVVSAVTEASPGALRKDSAAYPAWITEQYLQLPNSVPDRVKGLAAEITANTTNAYDKANAIEKYLRTYKYNRNISAPPAGQDGVDYFLFDVKEGYCDYYASAMIVMLRSVGVPARFVVGYTPGQLRPTNEQNDEGDRYRVLERNAHAWPEVYFPSYGWGQFEPTASEPLLARPADPAEALDPGQLPDQGPVNPEPLTNLPEPQAPAATDVAAQSALAVWLRGHWGWLAAVAVLVAALIGGWRYLRWRQVDLFRDSEVLARLFGLLGMWANRLRIPWRSSQTPLERAAVFNAKLPEAAPAVDVIANLFIAQQYGRQQPAPESITGLAKTWQQLQPRLWRRWLVGQIRGREVKEVKGPEKEG